MNSKPINIALSPNTERDDVLLASKLLTKPNMLLRGLAVKQLEDKFKEFLPIKHAFAMRSGRSALYTTLLALNLKEGDEVLLQSYTCAAVPNAVIWAHGKPVYIDIDPLTFNIDVKDLQKKINAKSRVIIVQHTFGLPADLKEVVALAKKFNLTLIEDCAHSIGSKYHSKRVGTLGDVAIMSFGRDKVISGVAGGMIVTNNDILANKIKFLRIRAKLPSEIWTIRHLLHPVIMNRAILPTYGAFSLGKILLEISKFTGIVPKSVYEKERVGERVESMLGLMPNALAMLVLRQLKKLNKFNEHRIKIAGIYNELLKDLVGKNFILPKYPDTGHIYLRYTIRTPDAEAILRSARKANILLGDWYRPAIAPAGTDYTKLMYDPTSCPVAERVSLESLNLPTNINIREEDAIKIAKFIRNHHGLAN